MLLLILLGQQLANAAEHQAGQTAQRVDRTASAIISDDLVVEVMANNHGEFSIANIDFLVLVPDLQDADLSLTKTVDDQTPDVGANVVFTVSVANAGPSDATGVTVEDDLPSGYSYVSHSGGSYDSGTGVWSAGAISATETVELIITATVQATGNYTNVAQVTAADQADPDSTPANDTGNQSEDDEDKASTTPTVLADLTIVKVDSHDPAAPGEVLTYTLTVHNNGPSDASNVVVTDTLPAGLSDVTASTSCNITPGDVICNLGVLANGATEVITIASTIDQVTGGTLVNQAEVGSDTLDPVGPNSTIETTATAPEADLTITKDDSHDPAVLGEALTYTLTVHNNGPSDAVNVVVTDTLPFRLNDITATTGCNITSSEVICNLGVLANGATDVITITGTSHQGSENPLVNQAAVGSDTLDPTGPNSVTETTVIVRAADLTISKVDSHDPAAPGETLIYTLTVHNNGPFGATSVVVTDTLPTGVNNVTYSGDCALGTGEVVCNLGNMNDGSTAVFTIAVTIDQGITETLVNEAVVGSETPDITVPNIITETTSILAEADLTITKVDSHDPATPGEALTYTLTVHNNGPSNASNVIVTDTLPFSVSNIIHSAGCTLGTGEVVCNLGDLAADGTNIITIAMTIDQVASSPLVNQAEVGSDTQDSTLPNDVVETTSLAAKADLTIAKTESHDPVTAGKNLTYTLTVHNNGPSNAPNVVVTDTLPSGTIYYSASAGCTPNLNEVVCILGDQEIDATSLITVAVTVSPDVTGTLTNLAQVDSDALDIALPNTTTLTTTVVADADLTISKTDSPDPVTAGEDLYYSLTTVNNGPSSAVNVIVTDTLPASVTYASASAGCALSGVEVVCNLGDLTVDAASIITITVNVDPGASGSLDNWAEVGSDTLDSILPNSILESTTVQSWVDLAIGKTGAPDPIPAGELLTYTLVITNSGPSNALNVVVTDTLPLSTTVISATAVQNAALIQVVHASQSDPPSPDSAEIITIDASDHLSFNDSEAKDIPDLSSRYNLSEKTLSSVLFGSPMTSLVGECTLGATVTCILDALAAGDTAVIYIVVRVDPSAKLPLENNAEVTASTAEINIQNNSVIATTIVTTTVDLSITKLANPDPVVAGNSLTYTLIISNPGPSNATEVVVTDTVGFGAVISSTVTSQGTGCTGTSPSVCDLGDMVAQSTATITIVASISDTTVITIGNTAEVASLTFDNFLDNNTALNVTSVDSFADLAIGKVDSPDPVTAGMNLTYTLTITNLGPSAAAGVVMTDILPSGLISVTSEISQGTGCSGESILICNLDLLTAQSSRTITIVGTVDSTITETLTNLAQVGAVTPDLKGGNNTVTVTTAVNAVADLTVTKADWLDPVAPGTNLTYTLTITNMGPSDAVGVMVTDTLSIHTPLVLTSVSQGSPCEGTSTITCTLGTITANHTAAVTIVVGLDQSLASVVITNSTGVTSQTPDTNTSNNRDVEDTTVIPQSDVAILKSALPDPVISGTILTYTLGISNFGPSLATGIIVTDTLPPEVTFNSVTAGQGTGCTQIDQVVCNLGALSVGTSIEVTIVVTVAANFAGTIENFSMVAGDQNDPQPENNAYALLTSVSEQGTLPLVKTDTPDPVKAGTNLTYTLHVSSTGPSDVFGVTLTDTLPTEASFITVTQTVGTCLHQAGTVLCDLGDMPVGSEATIQIITFVDPYVLGQINNAALLGAEGTKTSIANQNTTVVGSADLSIGTDGSPNPVIAGESLTYTVIVTNSGPSVARQAVIHSILPEEVIFISSPDCTPVNTVLNCALGDLAVNETVTVTIFAEVSSDTIGLISGSATVFSNTPDPDSTNNSGIELTNVVAWSDLGISKTGSADQAVAGTNFSYTLSVNNGGPSMARNVVVTDSLPTGVTLVSAVDDNGNDCIGATELNCNLGMMAVSSVSTITIEVSVDSAKSGILLNSAGVTSDSTDPNPANDQATEQTPVIGVADLGIIKTDSVDPIAAGTTLTYLIAVNNEGPSDASAVVVTDTLPGGVSFVSAVSSQGQDCLVVGVSPTTVICALGDLIDGASATVTIVVDVESSQTEPLQNSANVGSTMIDPNPLNNIDSEVTGVVAWADLVIGKDSAPSPVLAGELLTYTITVSNTGPSDATGVEVIDNLPGDVVIESAVASQGPGCTGVTTILCDLESLSLNASAGITIVVKVDPFASGRIENLANVSGDQSDPNSQNNSVVEFSIVTVESDLGMRKIGLPNPVVAGTHLTYTLSISNSGPSAAMNVIVTDSLPPGTIYVSSTTSLGTGCLATGNEVTCDLATLLVESVVTATLVVDVESWTTGVLSNSAIVTSDSVDPNPANDGATESSLVVGVADLGIVKTDSVDPVTAGTTLTYLLTTTNEGPSDASNVVVSDTLPLGVLFVSATPSQGDDCAVVGIGTVTITCALGDLGNGESATVSILVDVAPGQTEPLENTASAISTTSDPNPANDEALEVTGVVAEADLIIGKDSSPDPLVAGEMLIYTIQIQNAGPSSATGVVVTDTLPIESTFISASTGCNATEPIRCDIGPLSAQTGKVVTIVVRVDAETIGTIINTATVSGNQTDPVSGNNDAAELTTVLEKIYYTFLPLTLKESIDGEPNDICDQAHTIYPNNSYEFLPNDPVDWYQFDLPGSGTLIVEVTNFVPLFGQVAVFIGDSCSSRELVGSNGNPGTNKTVNAGIQPAGHYYVFISNDGTMNDQDPYNLRVNFVP